MVDTVADLNVTLEECRWHYGAPGEGPFALEQNLLNEGLSYGITEVICQN